MATLTNLDARYMSAMVDLAGTARGPRHTPPGHVPWIAATQACLIIALLVMACGAIFWCRPARGTDLSPADRTVPAPGTPLSFEESVKIALRQSPYLAKSSVEIDIRRLDEADSRYGVVPPLTFRTFYYVNTPTWNGISSKPYSLSFSTDPYNPLGAYLALQAQKLATQIAILIHLKNISKGLERLGQFYLELNTLNNLAAYQTDLITAARESLTYMDNRFSIGTVTSLEVKVAQQELQLARDEQARLALSKKRVLAGLKGFLGLKSTQELTPDLRDSRRQVLGSFDPATTTLEQAKSRSYELKALEIKKQLQGYNVSLAIAKIFPTILFNTQTPDPLNVTTSRGLYVSFGLEIPVWDGFKRIRNVSRQKAVLRQIGGEQEAQESDLEDKWRQAQEEVQNAAMALKLAQSQEALARLKAHQNEVRYQSGEAPLSLFLEGRKGVLEAQKNTLVKNLEYDKAALAFRQVSGDLGYSYVDASSWQK